MLETASDHILEGIMKLLLHFAVQFLLAFLLSPLLMVAWNYVVPDVFGLPSIGILQAAFLLLVSSLIFK